MKNLFLLLIGLSFFCFGTKNTPKNTEILVKTQDGENISISEDLLSQIGTIKNLYNDVGNDLRSKPLPIHSSELKSILYLLKSYSEKTDDKGKKIDAHMKMLIGQIEQKSDVLKNIRKQYKKDSDNVKNALIDLVHSIRDQDRYRREIDTLIRENGSLLHEELKNYSFGELIKMMLAANYLESPQLISEILNTAASKEITENDIAVVSNLSLSFPRQWQYKLARAYVKPKITNKMSIEDETDYDANFNTDGKYFITQQGLGYPLSKHIITLWDWENKESLTNLKGKYLQFTDNHIYFASQLDNKYTIQKYNIYSKVSEEIFSYTSSDKKVENIILSPSAQWIGLEGKNHSLSIFKKGEQKSRYTINNDRGELFFFSSDNKSFIASDNSHINIYDVENGTVLKEFSYQRKIISKPTRKYLVTRSYNEDHFIVIWNSENGECVKRLKIDAFDEGDCVFNADETLLVVKDHNKLNLSIFETLGWTIMGTIPLKSEKNMSDGMAFHPDGNSLVVGVPGELLIINPFKPNLTLPQIALIGYIKKQNEWELEVNAQWKKIYNSIPILIKKTLPVPDFGLHKVKSEQGVRGDAMLKAALNEKIARAKVNLLETQKFVVISKKMEANKKSNEQKSNEQKSNEQKRAGGIWQTAKKWASQTISRFRGLLRRTT